MQTPHMSIHMQTHPHMHTTSAYIHEKKKQVHSSELFSEERQLMAPASKLTAHGFWISLPRIHYSITALPCHRSFLSLSGNIERDRGNKILKFQFQGWKFICIEQLLKSMCIHLFMALYSFILAHLFSVTFGVFPHSPAQLHLSALPFLQAPVPPSHASSVQNSCIFYFDSGSTYPSPIHAFQHKVTYFFLHKSLPWSWILLPNLEGNTHISKLPLVF